MLYLTLTYDGKFVISASELEIKIWNLKTSNEILVPPHKSPVDTVVVDNNRAISISADAMLKIWDLKIRGEVSSREIPNSNIKIPGNCYGYNDSDGEYFTSIMVNSGIIISLLDKTNLIVWDLEKDKKLHLLSHSSGIVGVAATPDGKLAISISQDYTARVWDLGTGDAITMFMSDIYFASCAISSDGTIIVIGEWSGWVHFLSLERV